MVASLSGCAASKSVQTPPIPIPGIARVRSVTVLPVRFVLEPTRYSRPEQETATSLQRQAESVLKGEIERLISSSGFGLRRLDTDDSTLQRKPRLASLSRQYLDGPDRALLRAVASSDTAPTSRVFPQTTPVDIVDFVVDSMGSQYVLFVQGSGTYTNRPGSKHFDETVPSAVAVGILGAILGVEAAPDTDLEKSAVETEFFLEARLVDVADRQVLWYDSVSFEKRIQEDDAHFDPRKENDLRVACQRLLGPLLHAQASR
jgi:hypothetical protein